MPLRRLTRFSRIELEKEQDELRAHDRGARRDPRRRASCCGRSSPTSSPRSPRPTAPRVVPSCSSRPAPTVTAAAAPLEVADDPCFALLSSTGLLARSDAPTRPPGQRRRPGQPRRDRLRGAHHRARRGRRAHLARPAAQARRARPAALPASANDPNLQGGVPVSEVLSLETGERALALTALRTDGPGPRPRHPPGRGQAGQPRGARQPRRVGGHRRSRTATRSSAPSSWRTGDETLCFITSDAQLLHFGADGVRPQGRSGGGIAGVRLATRRARRLVRRARPDDRRGRRHRVRLLDGAARHRARRASR